MAQYTLGICMWGTVLAVLVTVVFTSTTISYAVWIPFLAVGAFTLLRDAPMISIP